MQHDLQHKLLFRAVITNMTSTSEIKCSMTLQADFTEMKIERATGLSKLFPSI